jgi:glycogen debranching enzyme
VVHRTFYPSFDFEVRENRIESIKLIDSFFMIISFSDTESGAIELAKKGHRKATDKGKDRVFEGIKEDWDSFLSSIKGNEKKYKILLEEALTALRMNLYAPRNKMRYYCSAPCKIHFNYFWGWDTAFHALGINHFNSDLAIENLLTQFAGMRANGMLCSMIDDSLTPSSDISQPPAQAWAIDEIYKKTGNLEFLQEMYLKSKAYLRWFYKERDLDEGGLYEFHTAGETGWDDTPRFLGVREGVTIGTRITIVKDINF